MDPLIVETVEALRGAGWQVETADPPRPLAEAIRRRYPDLPAPAVEWATQVASCVSPYEGCWMLAAEDYGARPEDDQQFRWDEFERMATERDGADLAGAREAAAFWDRHFPILLYVAGDYEYVALCTDPQSPDRGKAMHGDVADYDSPRVLADSFAGFLAMLRDAAAGPATGSAADGNPLVRLVHEHIAEEQSVPAGFWGELKSRLFGR